MLGCLKFKSSNRCDKSFVNPCFPASPVMPLYEGNYSRFLSRNNFQSFFLHILVDKYLAMTLILDITH